VGPFTASQAAYGAYPRGGYTGTNTGQEGLAIAGMICGIIAVFTVCCWPLSILLAIAGGILSGVSLKSRNRGMAIAGLVCSIVAAVLVGLLLIGMFASVMTSNSFSPTFK
jgi:hypothetical protein